MKEYPSIQRDVKNVEVYAFDKLDGSNIRAEWSKKLGFHKYGTRHRMLDENNPMFSEAIDLIGKKYVSDLEKVFREQKYESAIAFFEFFGPSSFAGQHVDEVHDVVLFDVNPYKKGILMPADFLRLFGHLEIAKLLYNGVADDSFVQSIKDGSLAGISFEGVVCKALNGKTPMPLMFKIKTDAWINALKTKCGSDEELFKKLL